GSSATTTRRPTPRPKPETSASIPAEGELAHVGKTGVVPSHGTRTEAVKSAGPGRPPPTAHGRAPGPGSAGGLDGRVGVDSGCRAGARPLGLPGVWGPDPAGGPPCPEAVPGWLGLRPRPAGHRVSPVPRTDRRTVCEGAARGDAAGRGALWLYGRPGPAQVRRRGRGAGAADISRAGQFAPCGQAGPSTPPGLDSSGAIRRARLP